MNLRFLITRPRHDITTHYLFNWTEGILELAKKKGISVLDLRQKRANKKEVISIVAKTQPFFIYFNGHGEANCIKGNEDEIIIKVGENEKILKDKIIYALSCKSAQVLGPESIKVGALSYLGYDDDFIFLFEIEKISHPLNDKVAALFLNPSNRLVISILKGHTVGEAYRKSQELFSENIQKIITSESYFNTSLVPYLLWDKIHQVCLGDKKASFS